jgi:AAA domain
VQIAHRWKPLLIFDSLIRFHESDENSATEMAPVMAELRALAHAGATVVALHHRAKSEASRYRGSSDILGGVDVAFAVSRDRDAGLLRLQCFKSRFAAEFSLTLRPELESHGGFALADSPAVSREAADTDTLRRLIATEPGLSQTEVLKRSALSLHHCLDLLRRGDSHSWRAERGPRGTLRYYPLAAAGQPAEVLGSSFSGFHSLGSEKLKS